MDKKTEKDVVSQEIENLNKQSAELEQLEQLKQQEKKEKRSLSALKAEKEYKSAGKLKFSKKIVLMVCIILVVAITGGIAGYFTIFNPNQRFSYGPKAEASEKTEEITKKHQERLNKLGKPSKGISFVGYRAYYTEDKGLIVDGYVRNGTGHRVYNLNGTITIKKDDQEIASAFFDFPDENFGYLKSGESRPWRLIFDAEYIKVDNADLSKYVVEATMEYYKTRLTETSTAEEDTSSTESGISSAVSSNASQDSQTSSTVVSE